MHESGHGEGLGRMKTWMWGARAAPVRLGTADWTSHWTVRAISGIAAAALWDA